MTSQLLDPVTLRPPAVRRVSSGAVIAVRERALVPTSGGAVTVLAPSDAGEAATFHVTDSDGSAPTNPITVDGHGRTIDGASTLLLTESFVDASFILDGGVWKRVAPFYSFGDPAAHLAPGDFPYQRRGPLPVSGPVGAMGALDVDWSTANIFTKTLSAGANLITFSNEVDGQIITVVLTSDVGGSTVTWPASVQWTGGTEPTQTSTGVDVYTFVRTGGVVRGSYVQNFS